MTKTINDTEGRAAMRDLAGLAGQHATIAAHLAEVIEGGNMTEQRAARRALVGNARVLASIVRYLADPPTFDWHFNRAPFVLDGVEFAGAEEWSIHT